jgi:hypothetical protein
VGAVIARPRNEAAPGRPARRAQLQHELGRVDHIGGVGGEREDHQAARAEPSERERRQIGAMQRQHQHAEHVLPEEGGGEQVAPENDLLPDRAGDHDRIEGQGFDHDRKRRGRFALARGEVAQHEREADEEDEELGGGEDPLDDRPPGSVAPLALLRGVERLWLRWGRPTLAHPHCPRIEFAVRPGKRLGRAGV